jgi:hypothetical protein
LQTSANPAQSSLGPQATFALVNYNIGRPDEGARSMFKTIWKLASNMIDDQVDDVVHWFLDGGQISTAVH